MESLVFEKKEHIRPDSTQAPLHSLGVYHLGHGGVSKSNKDIKILEELQQNGVISQIYPW